MLVVREKHLILEYDEELETIIQTWIGYFSSESFRDGVERTNKLFAEKRPVKKFLVDASNSSVVKSEDTSWAAQTAIPIAVKYGLKYYGFVQPANGFTQVALNHFKQQLNQPSLEIGLFESLEEAKAWVRSFD